MLCFRCGSHNPDGSEFCAQCGQKFIEQKKPVSEITGEVAIVAGKSGDLGGSLKPGFQLAERYEIQDTLGVGPIGTVYRAHDLEIDVDVAIKVVSPKLLPSRNDRKQFLLEIRNVRKINHPNVVRLYDEDQHEDFVFITMQLLEGLNLRKIIKLRKEKKQQFSIKEIEPIFSLVCQALDRAHETAVHGDLKPENIVVLPDMLKVTDFGLVEALPRKSFIAAQKVSGGGYPYLAPEVCQIEGAIEPAADIYSMGVILCEMLTGELYQGEANGSPALGKEQESLLPLLRQALNEDPAKRFRSAREFFEEFHALAAPGSRSRVSKAPPRPAPSHKEQRPAIENLPKKEPQSVAVSRPPSAAPGRKKVSFGLEEPPLASAVEPPVKSPAQQSVPVAPSSAAAPEVDKIITEEIPGADKKKAQKDDAALAVEANRIELQDEDVIAQDAIVKPIVMEGTAKPEHRVAKPLTQEPIVSAQPPKTLADQVLEPISQKSVEQPASIPLAKIHRGDEEVSSSRPSRTSSRAPAPRSRFVFYTVLSLVGIAVLVGTYVMVSYIQNLQDQLDENKAITQTLLDKANQSADIRKTQEHAKVEENKNSINEPSKGQETNQLDEIRKNEILRQEEARKIEEAKILEEAKKAEEAKKSEQALRDVLGTPDGSTEAKDQMLREEKIRKELEQKKAKEEEQKKEEQRLAEERAKQEKDALRKLEEEKNKTASAKVPGEEPSAQRTDEKTPATTGGTATGCPRGMVTISGGKALVGSAPNDPLRNFGEMELHAVEVRAFCIDIYEYPNAMGRKPATGVSWQQAEQSCRRDGKRLCTEDEWEYACKGRGNPSFPYGSKWDAGICNTENANGEDREIVASGSFTRCRSAFGIADMSGNVSEWTASKWAPTVNDRVYKGGSSTRPDYATRCASRNNLAPSASKGDLGFRCCADQK